MRKYADGRCIWWLRGKKHRNKGPAVVYAEGSVEYWHNGKLHRTDGPAVIPHRIDGQFKEWWFRGVQYASEFELQVAMKGREDGQEAKASGEP